MLKSWKLLLGVGGACAVCCTLPLVGGIAAVASLSSALLACFDELRPVAWAAAGVAVVASVLWFWRRRVASRRAGCGCGPSVEGMAAGCGGSGRANR